MEIQKVTFFGYADTKEDSQEYKDTFEAAKMLAQKGYTVVNGGGPGVMRAASLGAKAGGGKSIGVTLYPETDDDLLLFEGRDKLNIIDEEIKTHNYLERTLTLIEQGDAFVIMNGGTGTVSEFGMAWGLARLHYGAHKPLILYGSWWHDIMESFGENMHIRDEAFKVYYIVDSPKDIVDQVEEIKAQD